MAGLFIFASSQTEINVATQKVEVGRTCMCMCLLSTEGSLDVSVTKEKHTLGNRREEQQKKSFLHSDMTAIISVVRKFRALLKISLCDKLIGRRREKKKTKQA